MNYPCEGCVITSDGPINKYGYCQSCWKSMSPLAHMDIISKPAKKPAQSDRREKL